MFKLLITKIKNFNKEMISFRVERGKNIVDEEFYCHLKIEGFTDIEIKFRDVKIPKEDLIKATSINEVLEKIFYWGQNDFQPVKGSPSLSVGDIIHWSGAKYRIEPVGFKEIK